MSHHQENMFDKLESNDKEAVEDFKHNIRELFSKVQDPWLINGLYEYYLSTNSVRCLEILVTLREPHQQFLFDRICEPFKNSKADLNMRVQALTLLGHIVRNQPTPTWLHKLPEHALFKEILKFLVTEVELLPLVSALLLLIVMLPIFPSSIGKYYLEDIFDIFRRLAAWNSPVPGKLGEEQIIHLQVALYAYFLRLYGMYPCNFLSYLRSHFKNKNNPVFCHTIKPMMDTVKMHPSLITTSKENETSTERWKRLDVHDVIVECERFSLDITDRCPHETCQNTTEFRSRSGTMNSTVGGTANLSESSSYEQNIKSLASLQLMGNEASSFSPSQMFPVQTTPILGPAGVSHHHIQGVVSTGNYSSQEGSPPEAAIEATPETTPVRDFTATPVLGLASKTNVARALTSFRTNSSGFIVSGTPTNSVPSSPMRKEPSPFIFPARGESMPSSNLAESSRIPSGASVSQHLAYKLSQERQTSEIQPSGSKPPPSSPLKIINSDSVNRQRIESPMSQEDEEVSSISVSAGKSEVGKKKVTRACDSVLPDLDDSDHNKDGDDLEQGSPCTAGGLHMPNSKSINNFKKRIRRFRYHSQCNPEPERIETAGSSPGNGVPFSSNSVVRRANSCPDMKKSPLAPLKDNKTKPFYETDEETVSEDQVSNTSNGVDVKTKKQKFVPICASTQTDVFWPMPYEHLFFNIFPSLKEEATEIKPSSTPSPAPALNQAVEQIKPSLYDILDKYIEKCAATADTNSLRDQLLLVHQQLLFERYRRETHAYRNRRLLSDAKNTRLLEECNSALRDQVQLAQKEIDDLKKQLFANNTGAKDDQRQLSATIQYLKDKCEGLTDENCKLKEIKEKLESEIARYKLKCDKLDKERQEAGAALFDALAEGKVAREQAMAGEKVKQELQRANRELLLMGELHLQYRQRFERLSSMRRCDEEMRLTTEAYTQEIKSLQQLIDTKTTTLEVYRARLLDLENVVAAKEEIIGSQKRTLAAVNEDREALLEAVESKYQAQLVINRTLEEKILELRHKLEVESYRRKMNSPDTSSCHEVQVTTAAGLSAHSSPLSASLASSEGSAAFQEREAKNSQMCDEGSSKGYSEEGQLGHSSKND